MHIKDILLFIVSMLAVFIGAALMSGRNPDFKLMNFFEKHKNKELGFALIVVSLGGVVYSFYSESDFPIGIWLGAIGWVSLLILGLKRPIHHRALRISELGLAVLFIVWMSLADDLFIFADLVLISGLVLWLFALAYSGRKKSLPVK